ncbi:MULTISPECIES: DUF1330 domain-containing protein [Streptomyces]|uniref:DUF1330 domain-containing protein n=1 Tax=Streptomyces TaxID=1883 RepID=UPI001D1374A6|nr:MULTISPECIES: DUF1330 domain-containing protein [Streptomyces]MCC3652048.1 DUF1330 domain-containing protein [Streptomyces sp. S07_1.15]WSQ73246.1 DUF1330 domain-containing protein [Streptomyces xinghaiensis]
MPAYAIGHFTRVRPHPDVIDYVERIQATLDPYSGRFLVHGGPVEALEGECGAELVVIEFPGKDEARAWYDSPAYQEILPLRTRHVDGDAFLIEGVGPDYDPARKGEVLRRSL